MNPALRNIVLSAPRLMYPEDVKGCVLSLRADRSNLRNSPVLSSGVTNQATWSDMSKYRNDVTLTNFGGTATSGFIKAPVLSSKGIPVSYTNVASNGNFADETGWATINGTGSVANNTYTMVGDGTSGTVRLSQRYVFGSNPEGKRFFFRTKITKKDDIAVTGRLTFRSNAGGTSLVSGTIVTLTTQSQQYSLIDVLTFPSWSSTDIYIYPTVSYADAATANGKTSEIQYVQVINLSNNTAVQALEAQLGRNLTAEECDRLFAFTATSASVTVDTPYSLSLDGTNDYGSLVNTPSLDITTNEFALCCTFSVGIGSGTTSLICKGLTALATDTQYALVYNSTNKAIDVYLNSAVVASSTNSSILENTFYIIIVYRDTSGNISIYINKVVNASASYATALVTRANMRIGARSTNAGGTTHASYVKGGIQTMSIYQAPSLDINKILRVEGNISKDYTGVA